MKANIQKLLILLKQKEEKAMKDAEIFSQYYKGEDLKKGIATGKAMAFSSCIQFLNFILNSDKDSNQKKDIDNKTWTIEISQNDWEYKGYAIIKAKDVVKVSDNYIIADGIEIEFDEEINEPKISGVK